jgi:murein biosynthesis integral membrane protein MurJ
MLAVLAGFLLDIVIAWKYGAGAITDSFFVAARVPLGVWALAVAAANQALVPAFSASLAGRGEAATWRLASILITTTLLVGGAVDVAVWVLAGPLVHVTAPGLPAGGAALAAQLVPITFAIIPLVTSSEILRALLNARYSFVVPAATNIVLSGTAALVIFSIRHDPQVIAWAYLAGAVMQFAFIAGFAFFNGFRFRPSLRLKDEHFTSVASLSIRPIIAGGLNPIARLAEQVLLSFLPTGSITIVAYGYRLISAVGGTVFFRSVMVTLLPRLSAIGSNARELNRLTGQGLRIMLALSVPLTVFVAVLGRPGAVVVFQRGRFTRDEALLLGTVITVYAASLIGSATQRALQAPFFALLDTWTPLWTTLFGVLANLVALPLAVGAIALVAGRDYAVIGVPIAFSIGTYAMAIQAAYKVRKVAGSPWSGLGGFTTRLALSSIVSGLAMMTAELVFDISQPRPRPVELALAVGIGLLGTAVFAGAAAVLMRQDIRRLRRQDGGSSHGGGIPRRPQSQPDSSGGSAGVAEGEVA